MSNDATISVMLIATLSGETTMRIWGYVGCYSKWKAGDGVSAVDDSSVTRGLGARAKEIHLSVQSLVFSVAKSSSHALC